MSEGNVLYYGDNLDVLRRHISDESVDLVYLDPPFKSNQDYNVLFADHGVRAAAQIKAFEDTWSWDEVAAAAYDEVVTGGGRVADAMVAFRRFLGDNDMLAYLSMMAPRLVELRRVLKSTGSIYLHCDPTASHYLKMLMDAIFGPERFLNEIVWKRTNARSTDQKWPRLHDILLTYGKAGTPAFHPLWVAADKAKLPHTLITGPDGEKYQTFELTAPGETKAGDSGKPWRGFDPTAMGRHWANNEAVREQWDSRGLIHWPNPAGSAGGFPRRRAEEPFVEADRRVLVGDVWTDIDRINQSAKERLGYPTQKPEALLERIIEASSAAGQTVLDPFCGCGTTVAAAQGLGRRWIGIDITYLAISLIKSRLTEMYGQAAAYKVVGEPTTLDDAAALASSDPYQFQFWALGLVGARPIEEKKGADRGIDGRLYFNEGVGDTKQIIISVKAGKLFPTYADALVGVVQKEGAQIGVLISFNEPSRAMRAIAASAGFYESSGWGKFPRLQLLTVGDLLEGKGIEYPRTRGANVTYKKARAAKVSAGDQLPLVAEGGPDEPYGEETTEPAP